MSRNKITVHLAKSPSTSVLDACDLESDDDIDDFTTNVKKRSSTVMAVQITQQSTKVQSTQQPTKKLEVMQKQATYDNSQQQQTPLDQLMLLQKKQRELQEQINLLESQQRLEKQRVEPEQLEKQRVEAERLEKQRVEAERLEKQRVEAERIQKQRAEAERIQKQRVEAERLEKQRVEAEQLEKQRVEAERIQKQRLETEQLEKQRVEAERIQKQRVETERLDKELRFEQELRSDYHSKRRRDSSSQSPERVLKSTIVQRQRVRFQVVIDSQVDDTFAHAFDRYANDFKQQQPRDYVPKKQAQSEVLLPATTTTTTRPQHSIKKRCDYSDVILLDYKNCGTDTRLKTLVQDGYYVFDYVSRISEITQDFLSTRDNTCCNSQGKLNVALCDLFSEHMLLLQFYSWCVDTDLEDNAKIAVCYHSGYNVQSSLYVLTHEYTAHHFRADSNYPRPFTWSFNPNDRYKIWRREMVEQCMLAKCTQANVTMDQALPVSQQARTGWRDQASAVVVLLGTQSESALTDAFVQSGFSVHNTLDCYRRVSNRLLRASCPTLLSDRNALITRLALYLSKTLDTTCSNGHSCILEKTLDHLQKDQGCSVLCGLHPVHHSHAIAFLQKHGAVTVVQQHALEESAVDVNCVLTNDSKFDIKPFLSNVFRYDSCFKHSY